MLRFYSLLFLMILSTSVLYAQYTGNREKFAKEFDKSMSGYIYGEYEDFSKKILPELIESDKLSDDQFEVIYKTVNKMIQKRLPSFPAVYNYVYAYSAFILRSQPTESLNNWQKGVDNLLSGKNLSRFKGKFTWSQKVPENFRCQSTDLEKGIVPHLCPHAESLSARPTPTFWAGWSS